MIMKKSLSITACIAGILTLAVVSCSKEQPAMESTIGEVVAASQNPKLRSADKKKNPYSLEIMQAALDSLMKTKSNMDTLLNNLCATYPSKATAINELMSTYGL